MTSSHRAALIAAVLGLTIGSAVSRAQNFEVDPALTDPAFSQVAGARAQVEETAAPAGVAQHEPSKLVRRTYQISLITLGAATAADIGSSIHFSRDGIQESNPLLRSSNGGFGTKGTLIEAGIFGAAVFAQYCILKLHPERHLPMAIANFAWAGFQAWNVHHNVSY